MRRITYTLVNYETGKIVLECGRPTQNVLAQIPKYVMEYRITIENTIQGHYHKLSSKEIRCTSVDFSRI